MYAAHQTCIFTMELHSSTEELYVTTMNGTWCECPDLTFSRISAADSYSSIKTCQPNMLTAKGRNLKKKTYSI